MQDAVGIKETLELFDAADATSDAITKICEDKKLTVMDLRHAVTPIKAAITAVKGSGEIPNEMRDLDAAEVEQLIERLEQTGEKVAAAKAALEAMRDEA